MFTKNRTYSLSVIGLMALYSVLCFAVPETLESMGPTGQRGSVFVLLIGASPSYPLAAVLVLYVRQLQSLDEFQQKVQLLSLAVTTGLILISGTAYGFVVLHLNYPEFPLFLILPIYLAVWGVSSWLVKRSYV